MFENYKNANNGLNTNFGKSNVWDDDVKISTYLNDTYYNKLTSVAKNQIMRHEWNIGVITYSDDYPAAQLLIDEAKEKWIGNIGTLNPSDYFYASLNEYCIRNTVHNYFCKPGNWLFGEGNVWMMNRTANSKTAVSIINGNGEFSASSNVDVRTVRPVVYLKSDIKLTGLGTLENPYEIITEEL